VNNTETTRQTNFRSALGGYNKEDVNRYIKETDLANSAKEQEFSAKVAALEEDLNTLAAARSSLQEELKTAQAQIVENTRILEERAAEKEELAAQIARQAEEIADLQKHVGLYKDQAEAQNVMIEGLKKEAAEAAAKFTDADTQRINAEQAVDTLSSALEEYKQRCAQAEDECAKLKDLCADAENRMKSIQADLESAVAEEKNRAEEEIRAMRESIEAETEGAAHKLQMYDKISGQIGDILLNANRNADEILAAAREEAEKLRTDAALEAETLRRDTHTEVTRIRSETEDEANYIRERLSDTANQLLSQISGEMHVNIDNCIKEVNTCIQEMQYDTDHMLNVLKSRYREMNERIQYYQSCVTDAVEQKLHDMDEKYGIRKEEFRDTDGAAE